MIDKAVAKLTGFGPQGTRTENRGQTSESVDATALGRLFQKHLSTLGGNVEATGAAFFQGSTDYGQAEPPSRNDYDDYMKDRPAPTSDDAAAANERRERPQESTTDAPREPARSDDAGGRSEAAAPHEDRTDTSARDDGRKRGGDEGDKPATAQEAGDTDGGSQKASSGGDDEGTAPASSGETTNAASGTPAADGAAAQGATAQTAAGTTATTATAQGGSAGATQDAGNAAPAGKAQQSQGQASDTGKQATTVAPQGEAPKTGGNAGNHGLGGDQANPRQQQMPGNADKPAPTQAADPQARARQGQEISQAIGRVGEGSKVEVKVSTDVRGAGRGPTIATSQDGIAASGSNASSGQAGGQTGGSNQQTAQAQLAQQQAALQQAQNQASQQVQPQNQQAGQRQAGAGPVATSPAAAASAAGSGASHALQGGGEGSLQASSSGAAGGSQSQSSQQAQSSAHTTQPQRAAQGGQPVADQVSVKITKAVQAGQDRIHIQLKPAELGRVDVRIEMTHDGRAVTIVTADKADTLDLMRRDAEQLQKALADAGLETGSGDLSFNLRGEGQEGEETKDTAAGSQLADGDDTAGDEVQSGDDGVMLALDSGILMPGHVDLRA